MTLQALNPFPLGSPGKPEYHRVSDLEIIFRRCFYASTNTILETGADEPVYLPSGKGEAYNRVISTRDYFSSALHEISHWCIAGEHRRTLEDYGYWYEPDGRDSEMQKKFEQVEVQPQALEWVFSWACAYPFRLSVDNVACPEMTASQSFKEAVLGQARSYAFDGLCGRAKTFFLALRDFYVDECSETAELYFDFDKLR